MKPIPTFLAFLTLLATASAQEDSFPEIYNSEPDKNAAPPSPQDALASFQLPEGFNATIFAAEPEVQNPIAMAWDKRGRMWVAENFTYAEKGKRLDLALRDRILIFEDSDGDGKADSRKVFSDKLSVLTSVETGRGGVWAMCPPQLLFIPDRDGDDVPDSEPEVLLDGFTVAESNYHNFANGLHWGPDGWLYGRVGGSCPGLVGAPGTADEKRIPLEGGIWRYHPERKVFEVLTHGATNPWGHDWDENGQAFFINTVNGHLWHLIPGSHLERPFAPSPNKKVYVPLAMHAGHWHFDRTGSWTDSREGAANKFGGGHAHIGMCVYQGGALPDSWDGKLLTWNQHGRRVNMERLEREGSGFVGKHEPDVLISGDPWFRGLEINTGPDGALYALDWSDTGECHDHTGVHRTSGRIYKFAYGEAKNPDFSDLENIDAAALARLIKHPNVWFERQMRNGLTPSPELISAARSILDSKDETKFRLRALWALHELGDADRETLISLLADPNENLRVNAIQLLMETWPIDGVFGPIPHLIPPHDAELLEKFSGLAKTDSSGLVRLALSSTLQRLPLADRAVLAAALGSREEDAADHNLPYMVWFGISPLSESDPASLVKVAEATAWPDLLKFISRALAGNIETKPDPVASLINLAVAKPALAPHILNGLSDGFKGWRKAPIPANWSDAAAAFGKSEATETLARELSALFGDGRALDSLKETVFDETADLASRETALKTLIDARPDDLRNICEKLIGTRHLNRTAVRGLGIFDDPEIGVNLSQNYGSFWPGERPAVIDVLVSRSAWAAALLKSMESGKIPRKDLTPFHARQILSFNDDALSAQLKETWGEVAKSDEAKEKRIKELHAALTPEVLAKADLSKGRELFASHCSACHLLYGEGGKLGPDLTGSGRADLGYLLENIVAPSAVVPNEYRMTVFTLKDGRAVSGVTAASTDRTITVRSFTEETTIEKSQIASKLELPNSIMPDGLIDSLTPEQTRDLIGYLMNPVQVPLPEAGKK